MDSKRMRALAAGLILAAFFAGCQDQQRPRTADGVVNTKFPGGVASGGGTSGEVMARSQVVGEAGNVSGTPGIPAGAGGNTGGTATGGKMPQTQGSSSGATQGSEAAGSAGNK